MESYLGSRLTLEGAMAQYDRIAKQFLAIRQVLAYIMIHAIKEYHGCTIEEAMAAIDGDPVVSRKDYRSGHVGPEIVQTGPNESTSSQKGQIYYDIVFYAYAPNGEHHKLWINIEAQKSFYPGYDLVTRGVYYSARLLSDELDKEFTAHNYNNIKKVYSIWICMNPPRTDQQARQVEDTMIEYKVVPSLIYATHKTDIANVHTGRYDLMSTIFVNLTADGASENELIGMLSTLFSRQIPNDEKVRTLSEDYGLPMTTNIQEEVNTMCNISEWIVESTLAEAEEKYKVAYSQMQSIIADKDSALADKDSALADKDAEIARLKAQLTAAAK